MASYIPPLAFFDTDLIWDFLEDDSLKSFREINSAGVFNHFHSRLAKTKVKGADDYEVASNVSFNQTFMFM